MFTYYTQVVNINTQVLENKNKLKLVLCKLRVTCVYCKLSLIIKCFYENYEQ